MKDGWAKFFTIARSFCRTGRFRASCRRAGKDCGGWISVAGSGVTGDLLAHTIDTAMWLNGGIDEVSAMTETFIKSRKHNLTGQVEPVEIDDASLALARFRNGSLATFEATRYARGHKALYTLEINGENASIMWDLHDLHRLGFFDHKDDGLVRGWKSIHITDREHPYMSHWWVPGLQIGYEHTFIHQVADFLGRRGREERASDVSRGAGDGRCDGRRARIGGQPAVGEGSGACPTIKEVAELAGVSVGTVSHVITGSVPVTEPLRRKVQAAIKQAGLSSESHRSKFEDEQDAHTGDHCSGSDDFVFPAGDSGR